MDSNSLSHTKWNCKYHIVFAPKFRRKVIYGQLRQYGNRHFWCRGYYVDTVGKNAKKITEYIRNQLKEDLECDQMTLKEYMDPFTGEPVKQKK